MEKAGQFVSKSLVDGNDEDGIRAVEQTDLLTSTQDFDRDSFAAFAGGRESSGQHPSSSRGLHRVSLRILKLQKAVLWMHSIFWIFSQLIP